MWLEDKWRKAKYIFLQNAISFCEAFLEFPSSHNNSLLLSYSTNLKLVVLPTIREVMNYGVLSALWHLWECRYSVSKLRIKMGIWNMTWRIYFSNSLKCVKSPFGICVTNICNVLGHFKICTFELLAGFQLLPLYVLFIKHTV